MNQRIRAFMAKNIRELKASGCSEEDPAIVYARATIRNIEANMKTEKKNPNSWSERETEAFAFGLHVGKWISAHPGFSIVWGNDGAVVKGPDGNYLSLAEMVWDITCTCESLDLWADKAGRGGA